MVNSFFSVILYPHQLHKFNTITKSLTYQIHKDMPRQYFDALDLTILKALCENARTPYLEIAREYGVSGAAVHQRVQRLLAGNVIIGSHCDVNPATLGFHVSAFVGINVKSGANLNKLVEQIAAIPEITECNIVSGRYDLIVKLNARSNADILEIIRKRLFELDIVSTETMVSFKQPFNRPLPLDANRD